MLPAPSQIVILHVPPGRIAFYFSCGQILTELAPHCFFLPCEDGCNISLFFQSLGISPALNPIRKQVSFSTEDDRDSWMFPASQSFLVLAHIPVQWIKTKESYTNSSIEPEVMLQRAAFWQHSVFVRLNLLMYEGMNINPHGTKCSGLPPWIVISIFSRNSILLLLDSSIALLAGWRRGLSHSILHWYSPISSAVLGASI